MPRFTKSFARTHFVPTEIHLFYTDIYMYTGIHYTYNLTLRNLHGGHVQLLAPNNKANNNGEGFFFFFFVAQLS